MTGLPDRGLGVGCRPMLPLLLASALLAADGPAPAPVVDQAPAVALVDGKPITLRQVEDALLNKEGKEAVQSWVDQHLDRIAWERLKDEDPVLSIGFNRITRGELAQALVARGAGKVRDELINIAIVNQALAKEGVVVTDVQVRATWERMARKFQEDMAKKGNVGVDLANWIKTKEGMTIEQFQGQPGFRMLAGLQTLVHRRAEKEFDDTTLRAAFAGRPERYREAEAVDLQALFIPYRGVPEGGKVPPAEVERLMGVLESLGRQIGNDPQRLANNFEIWGKGWDPGAGAGGRLGWIPRDGKRLDGHPISDELLRVAWEIKRFPMVLPPIPDARGVTIAAVHGHRPQRDPDFEQVRERVRADLIDETLERRTENLLRELKDKAKVEYISLPGVKEGR